MLLYDVDTSKCRNTLYIKRLVQFLFSFCERYKVKVHSGYIVYRREGQRNAWYIMYR